MYHLDAHHHNAALAKKLAHIYTLRGGPTIDLTIRKPYLDLLDRLGNPHQNLPPVIHVAGTNGKGSTIAFLKSILNEAGYSTHRYTSPHLEYFNERIMLADCLIDDARLETLLDDVMAANAGGALTFFEITTAIALLAFSRVPADILLLETGMGGRLDCTNIIEKPLATIITRIGYDHTEFLGNSLQAIATEKAGIIKSQTPCIVAAQNDDTVLHVIRHHAASCQAPYIQTHTEWPHHYPPPALSGLHQYDNAQNALACVPILRQNGFTIAETAIQNGLANAKWAARLQRIDTIMTPPPPFELWYDGGHNENAAKALAAQAAYWHEHDHKPLYLALAMMRSKDPSLFLKTLKPYIQGIYCIGIPDEPAAFSPQELATTAQYAGITVIGTADNPAMITTQHTQPDSRILICGSLYIAQYLP